MSVQLTDEQMYAIKACLERASGEVAEAYKIFFGNVKPVQTGMAQTKTNAGGKNFAVPPPIVTKDHQAAVDSLDPDKQSEKAAGEQIAATNLKQSINTELLIIGAAANGQGDFFATLLCENTYQTTSVPIDQEEYESLQDVTQEHGQYITLNQDEIDQAEWEPVRGTSKDPNAVCNCSGRVPNTNPYNDEKIEAEMAAGHRRQCSWWDYNTITYDQNVGSPCSVALASVDKSADYGFDIYLSNRRQILARAADPNDPIVLLDKDNEEEFGLSAVLQQASKLVNNVAQSAPPVSGDEDDDDGC